MDLILDYKAVISDKIEEKMLTEVELRAAKIPYIGHFAVHYFFVIRIDNLEQRWEVWQNQHRCKSSWGHLHLNLLQPCQGVGNGVSWLEEKWQQENAQILAEIIQQSPNCYDYKNLYRYYPGPNSNTYVQWILDQAQINYSIGVKGIGKNYHRWAKSVKFLRLG